MTADGSNDDLIKLEGFPKGQMYEFMSTEIEEDDGSDCDEDFLDECFIDIPLIEPPIPDEDGEDATGVEEFEEVSNNPDDFEPSDEPLVLPEGYEAVTTCPDVRKLSGRKIMFLWDFGWDMGTVKKRIWKGQYNYFVQYPEDDGSYTEYRQNLTASSYHDVADETGHWIVIERR